MIYRYVVKTRKSPKMTFTVTGQQNQTYEFDGVNVKWEINSQGHFVNLIIDVLIPRDQLEFLECGNLNPRPEICYKKAYAVAQRVADNVAIMGGFSFLNPSTIQDNSVELVPTDTEEHLLLSERNKVRILSGPRINIYPNPSSIMISESSASSYDINSLAAGHFVSGLQASDPTHSCECYFKVLETLFRKKRKTCDFDRQVDSHLEAIGVILPSGIDMNSLRIMRNDCAHPDRSTHINRRDMIALGNMSEHLEALKLVAKCCLLDPPD